MKIIKILLIVFFMTDYAIAANHAVTSSDTSITASFDGGVNPGDYLILDAGTRGNIKFTSLIGTAENPIHIVNNASGKTSIVNNAAVTNSSVMEFLYCQYVQVHGDNCPTEDYGIYIDDKPNPTSRANHIGIIRNSDHMKFSYIEMTQSVAGTTGIGVRLGPGHEATEDASVIYDDFELHHLYIHEIASDGMYLSQNDPPTQDDPYMSNVDVHDCIFIKCGASAISYKGTYGGESLIYNNTILPLDRSSGYSTGGTDVANQNNGIRILDCYGGATTKIYNNYVEKTAYEGIKMADDSGDVEVYGNFVINCGIYPGADIHEINGISVEYIDTACSIHDNVIIQPVGYCIYARYSGSQDATYTDNLMADGGSGETGGAGVANLIDGGGNVYEAVVSDLACVATWTDDNDFSNDCFSLPGNPYTCTAGTGGTVQTGLGGSNISENELNQDGASGYTITLTVADDTWVATVGGDNAITDALIAGITCTSGVQAAGFAANISPKITYDDFTRTSDTVLTWNVEGDADYDISTAEIWQIAVPASALTSGVGVTASPDITISAVQASKSTSTRAIGYSSTGRDVTYGSGGRDIVAQ